MLIPTERGHCGVMEPRPLIYCVQRHGYDAVCALNAEKIVPRRAAGKMRALILTVGFVIADVDNAFGTRGLLPDN